MLPKTAIWIDGSPGAALPLPDRGLDFGDGVFETLLLENGRPLYQDAHLARLRDGLRRLDFPPVTDAGSHLKTACDAVRDYGWRWCVVRLTVTRGGAPRGYAPPSVPQPRIVCSATALDRDCLQMLAAAELEVAVMRNGTQAQLAGIKHLNRLEQVLIGAECVRAGCDEMLVLGQSDEVVSVNAGNIFIRTGQRLITPSLDLCGIAGTRRALVMLKWAPQLGLEVVEGTIDLPSLQAADEVFFTNSLIGLRPVKRCGTKHWDDHPSCIALFELYRDGRT